MHVKKKKRIQHIGWHGMSPREMLSLEGVSFEIPSEETGFYSVNRKRLDFWFKIEKWWQGTRLQVLRHESSLAFWTSFTSANSSQEATTCKLLFVFLAFLFFKSPSCLSPWAHFWSFWGNPICLLFRELDRQHSCISRYIIIFSPDLCFIYKAPFTSNWDTIRRKEKSREARGQDKKEGRIKQGINGGR